MHIDWFTFTAQIVNFLVLVGLLRYFLYGPIVRAMGEREARIADRLNEAEEIRADAAREKSAYEGKYRDFENQRVELLARAREEADARRTTLIDEARAEVAAMKDRWHQALEREKDAFLHEVRRRGAQQIFAVIQRALEDLADVDLDRQLAAAFIDRLRHLDADQRQLLIDSAKDTSKPVMIRSAFELPQDQREQLTAAIRAQLSDSVEVRFEQDPSLIGGLELQARSQRIGWDLRDYLSDLEERLVTVLNQRQTEAITTGSRD